MSLSDWLSNYKWELICLAIVWYGWDRWGFYSIRKAIVIPFVFYVGYRMLQDYLWKQKYLSPHVVADSKSWSCVKWFDWGNWRIYELGGIKDVPREMYVPEGVLVTPRESCGKLGEQHYTLAQCFSMNKDEIPYECRDVISREFPEMTKMFYGRMSRRNFCEKPKETQEWIREDVDKNTLISAYQKIIDHLYEIEMKWEQHVSVLAKERKGVIDWVKDKFVNKEKDEEELKK